MVHFNEDQTIDRMAAVIKILKVSEDHHDQIQEEVRILILHNMGLILNNNRGKHQEGDL